MILMARKIKKLPMRNGNRAAIYARYSYSAQREESIEAQVADCQRFAEGKGLDVVEVYADRALSGTTDHRERFQDMIQDAKDNKFDVIICYMIDRFSRNQYDAVLYRSLLENIGVRILYSKQQFDDSPEGNLMRGILESFAQFYVDGLSRGVKRGMKQNVEKGKSNGGNPTLGYRTGADGIIEIEPNESKIIQSIYKLRVQGRSINFIEQWCNENKLTDRKGKPFTEKRIRVILGNKRYLGIYTFEGKEYRTIPQIIDDETFDIVQQMNKERSYNMKGRAKATADYKLSGKLECGYCHEFMWGESGTGRSRTYNYYKCKSRKMNGANACIKETESSDEIDHIISQVIADTFFTEQGIEEFTEMTADLVNAKIKDKDYIQIEELRRKKKDVENRIEKIVDSLENGTPYELLEPRYKSYQFELEGIKGQLALEERVRKIDKDEIRAFLIDLKERIANEKDMSQKFINLLIDRVVIYNKNDTQHSWLNVIFKDEAFLSKVGSNSSNLVRHQGLEPGTP